MLLETWSDNTIGGATAGAGDLGAEGGNTGTGVEMNGTGTSSNVVVGDFIGADIYGTVAIANGQDGVEIDSGAWATRSGG